MSRQAQSKKSSSPKSRANQGNGVVGASWDEVELDFEDPIEITEPPTELGDVLRRIKNYPGRWVRVRNYPTHRGAKSIAGRLSKTGELGRFGKSPYLGFDRTEWDFEVRPIDAAGNQHEDGEGGAMFARYNGGS